MRVYRDDQKFLTFRINALLWAIVIVFVFLAGSFWVVQGVQAEKYRNLSEANALREIVTPAKRGLILDRSGQKILADNQPAYSLSLDRVIMRPIVKNDPAHRQKVAAFLSQVLGMLAAGNRGTLRKREVHPERPSHPDRRRPVDDAGGLDPGAGGGLSRAQCRAGTAPQLPVRNDGRSHHGLHR